MVAITGGRRLEEALARITARVSKPAILRVGFLERARYQDSTPVAMIAALQDFGTGTIPPRPFFRNMIAAKKGEWPAAIARLVKDNDYDAARALDIVGAVIAGQLRQSITDTNAPPLAESTIRRKGHSKPLIDTGHLFNSVDHEVSTT